MATRWTLAGAGLAFLAVLGACGGGTGEKEIPAEVPVQVSVLNVDEVSWDTGMEVTAGVVPVRRATPGTLLMGRVERIHRREGDRVRAGDVLAQIESRDVTARLEQAGAGVASARALEENARLTRERLERLHSRQAASRKSMEDAVAAHLAAAAALRAAEEEVKAAEVQLSYAKIRAPFGGVIAERMIEEGDMAAPGQPLFVLEETSRMKIEAQIPESALAGLEPGSPVEVDVEAASSGILPGTIAEILPAGDPRSRTFTVRVVLDNSGGVMRSGMFARLRLPGAERQALAVPESALVRRGPLTGVFLVDGAGRARLRWITTGERSGGRVEVLTGLNAGERIIPEPPPGLEDARLVEVR